MPETHETIADIIAEMRDEAARADMEQGYSLDDAAEMMREFAWRFDAAHKHERETADAKIADLQSRVKLWTDRSAELVKKCDEQYAKLKQVGDAAKLREAVIGLRDRISMFYKNEWIPYDEWEGANDDANSALAAPPRNCDVYNNESCRMAYHLHGDGLMTMQAFADWLYSLATEKEGGNDGNE